MNTVILALMHFLVDLICAWAMFGRFRGGDSWYLDLLVYNFCAFALQMPLGTLLDLLRSRADEKMRPYLPLLWTGLGVLLTAAGTRIHPAVLGLGNALFHVGGGMDVILEDFAKGKRGRDLGLFVAPGAIGLYLGTCIARGGPDPWVLITPVVLTVVLFWRRRQEPSERAATVPQTGGNALLVSLCCFAVVILRSWVGMSVSFSWKTGAVWPWLAVAAVALGKLSGGLLSARFGIQRTVAVSLLLAAACYILGEIPGFGLTALVLFNMSMPVTLYLLAENLHELPGFSFGLLTFGLFLGFLPVYAGVELPLSGTAFGAVASVASLLLLTLAERAVRHGNKIT